MSASPSWKLFPWPNVKTQPFTMRDTVGYRLIWPFPKVTGFCRRTNVVTQEVHSIKVLGNVSQCGGRVSLESVNRHTGDLTVYVVGSDDASHFDNEAEGY